MVGFKKIGKDGSKETEKEVLTRKVVKDVENGLTTSEIAKKHKIPESYARILVKTVNKPKMSI